MINFRALSWTLGIVFVFLITLIVESSVEARVGGGRSSGFKGSKSVGSGSYAAPTTRPQQPQSYSQPQPQPQASAGSSMFKNIAAGLAGGFLGSMLFQSLGMAGSGGVAGAAGGSSGPNILGILLLAVLGFFIYKMVVARKRAMLPAQGNYAPIEQVGGYNQPSAINQNNYQNDNQVEEQIHRLQSIDSSFEPSRFKDYCVDQFFNIQAAWMNQDLSSVKNVVADELYRSLEADLNKLKEAGQLNKIESIAVRQTEILEVRQEYGVHYITLRFYANLLDYTVDKRTGVLISGSNTTPVKFEEFWTYSRNENDGFSASNPWRLTAIEQAA
ncbi:MAG: Tim44 domain-containing protein [Oligoflexia bacterium]|nr:Tim44 domain-containing protein [Oligoflexia bacterium]